MAGRSGVLINRVWWEHLTPKVMHRYYREVDTKLQTWCQSEYGAFWLKIARQKNGVIRVRPNQAIPVVHFVSLPDTPIFVAPQERVRQGHRFVGPENLASGVPLDGDELVLGPEIRFDVARDPALLKASALVAARKAPPSKIDGVTEPSLVFSTPAHLLLAPAYWPKKSYVLYQHIFGNGSSYPNDGYFYVGVTTRDWQTRWREHRRNVRAGSQFLFHRKFREEMDAHNVTYIHHKVMGVTDDLEALYGSEERLVAGHWDDTRRLNMIPGGKSGLKYLRENGLLAARTAPEPDDRDRIVEAWLKEHPRKGLPAPWVAEKWKDNEWAIAQICGREDRLSRDQVRAIRELAKSYTPDVIAGRIGAKNTDQVQRVINGDTYTRVT